MLSRGVKPFLHEIRDHFLEKVFKSSMKKNRDFVNNFSFLSSSLSSCVNKVLVETQSDLIIRFHKLNNCLHMVVLMPFIPAAIILLVSWQNSRHFLIQKKQNQSQS